MTILGTMLITGGLLIWASPRFTRTPQGIPVDGDCLGQVAKRGGAAGEVLGNLADVNSVKAFLAENLMSDPSSQNFSEHLSFMCLCTMAYSTYRGKPCCLN